MGEVVLLVDGQEHSGWTRVNVELGVDVMAGAFDIGVVELADKAEFRAIPVGARCELQIDGETLITGWVDETPRRYDARERSLSVRGRDATGDLVDCSARHVATQWTNAKLSQIASDLARPFGIKVLVETDQGAAFPTWAIQESETVMENLQRAARQLGVLLRSDGLGNLVIGRAGTAKLPVALRLGENVVEASGNRSHLERFSEYRVLGQQPHGEDAGFGPEPTEVIASATDAGVGRYRPLDIIAEDNASLASAKQRAEWERNLRAGRALSATYTVRGWSYGEGLWKPNRLVYVNDPWLRITTTMFISGVRYLLDGDKGERAEITVTLPAAFDRIALPDPRLEPGQ